MKTWWVYQRNSWTWATHAESGEEAQVLIGVYVVADTRGRARVLGANEMNCEFTDVGVKRAPEYDGMTVDDIYAKHEWEWLV